MFDQSRHFRFSNCIELRICNGNHKSVGLLATSKMRFEQFNEHKKMFASFSFIYAYILISIYLLRNLNKKKGKKKKETVAVN